MRTLRVKLVVPDEGSYATARDVFETLSELHASQAIFQVNQTQYVGEDTWGFQIRYETEIHTKTTFVRSTSLCDIEQAMAEVAPHSFERRVDESSV